MARNNINAPGYLISFYTADWADELDDKENTVSGWISAVDETCLVDWEMTHEQIFEEWYTEAAYKLKEKGYKPKAAAELLSYIAYRKSIGAVEIDPG